MKVKLIGRDLSSDQANLAELFPQLVSFPSGIPEDLQSNEFRLSVRPVKPSSRSAVVRGEFRLELAAKHAEYTGVVPTGAPDVKYAIGLYDPSTRSVDLSCVQNVFSMNREERVSLVTAAQSQSTFGETRRLLIDDFGSKKRKRAMNAIDMNKVDIEKSGATGALAQARQSGAIAGPSDTATREFLPEYDEKTTNVNEIFSFEKMLTPEEISSIDVSELSQMVKSPSVLESNKESQYLFIVQCLQALKAQSREVIRATVRQIAYTSFLITMYLRSRAKIMSVDDLMQLVGCSEMVAESLIARFRTHQTDEQGNARYITINSQKVKLLCHLCVMSMRITSYTMSKALFTQLFTDLKLPSAQLYMYYQQIGCSIKKMVANDATSVSLSAPLKLPSLNQKSRPSKR